MKTNCLPFNQRIACNFKGFSSLYQCLQRFGTGAFLLPLIFTAVFFSHSVSAQTIGDYRTAQSGNWVSPSTWQYYNGTSWVGATNYPGQLSIVPPSYTVTIQQNHTVNMNQIAGTVGDSTPYLFNHLAIYGNLFLNGVNNAIVSFVLKAQNIMVYVTGPTTTGTITFNNKGYLFLPQNGNLLFEDPTRTTYIGGSCSNNMEIYFRPCPIPYAVCVGVGNSIYYTFAGLMAAGGSLFVAVDVSVAVGGQIKLCHGENLYINASSTGQAANTSLYSWVIKDPVTQATVYGPVSVTYPNINLGPVPGLNPGTYVAVLTATDNFQPTCPHSNSDSVYVYVEGTPDAPISGGNQLICPNASVNLSVTTNPANLTVNWYSSSTGGTPVHIGYTYTVSTPGTWYAEAISPLSNCPSARTAVTAYLDDEAPVFSSCPVNHIELGCNPAALPDANMALTDAGTPTDNYNVASVGATAGSPLQNGCYYTQIWTVTAYDDCNNAGVCYVTYNWKIDTQLPVISTQAVNNTDLGCNPTVIAPVFAGLDNCDGAFTPVVTTAGASNIGCNYSQTWTANYTDACGNMAVPVSITYTWKVDTEAPVWAQTMPASTIVECDAVPLAPTGLTATDNCDLNVTVSFNENTSPGNCPDNYVITRTWTAVDNCDNSTVHTQVITVQDTQAPIWVQTMPADATVECNAVPAAPIGLTANDICDLNVVVSYNESTTPGNCADNYTITRTWTAVDNCGNSTVHTQTITVRDTQAPTWAQGMPQNVTVECDNIPVVPTGISANDNCDASVSVLFNQYTTGGTCADSYTITRTWTATDNCGNSLVHTQTITVEDTEVPIWDQTMPGNITVQCDQVPDAPMDLSASDNCDTEVLVTFDEDITAGNCADNYTITRTWVAEDNCGNSIVHVQSITVQDTQAPVWVSTMPVDVTVQCDELPDAPSNIVADDNCDDAVTLSFTETTAAGNCADNYVITRKWTATDNCGNSIFHTQLITVEDTKAPVWDQQMPVNLTFECDNVPSTSFGTYTASDNCDTNVTVTHTSVTAQGNCPYNYVVTHTWTAADNCGNSIVHTTAVTVQDTEAPVFAECPVEPISLGCNPATVPSSTMAINDAGSALDNCGTVTYTAVGGAVSGTCFKSQIWVVTATDECNNSATCSVTYTWTDDLVAPVFDNCPTAVIDLGCNPQDMPTTNDAIVATGGAIDNCTQNVSVNAIAGNVTGTCQKTQVFTVTAEDDCGNTETCYVSYTWTDDEIAPVFANCPTSNISLGYLNVGQYPTAATAIQYAGSVTDNCTANLVVTAVAGPVVSGNGCLVQQTWTVTALDECGNDSECEVTFEWIEDDDDPYFVSCPQNQTLYTSQNDCSALASWATPVVMDNCGGQVNITVVTSTNTNVLNYGQVSTALFQKGVNVVTYTATDGNNNIATCQFTITVIDTVKPIITGCPTAIFANALPGTCSATVTWNQATIIPSDNCPGVSLTTNYTPGSVFTSGITYVTYTATDSVGLQTFCTFAVHVIDNQLPTITCAAPATNYVADLDECHYTHAGTSLDPVATSDNCGVDYVINNFNQAASLNGAQFPVGSTTVVWTVYDVNGNTATCNQVIVVLDTQLPTIDCPQNIAVNNNPGLCDAFVTFSVSAIDNCPSYIVNQTAGLQSGNWFPVGTTTNVFKVTDASGNSAACSFMVVVTDVDYPVIVNMPADFDVATDPGMCNAVVTWTLPIPDDNCGIASFTSNYPSGTAFPVGTTTVIYTAIDNNGLITTASFDVTVTDNEYPVISGYPGNFFYQNDPGMCSAVITWASPVATDNCAINTFTSNYISGYAFPVGLTTVTYTATDIYGNITTASFNVTIADTEKPQIVAMPANIIVNNDPEQCSAEVKWTQPTATDNCGVASLTSNLASGAIFPVGTTTVVYTAVDLYNNMQTASFTITVIDNEAPVILNIPADITVSNDQGVCEAEVYWNEPTEDDNCQILTFTSNYDPGDIFPVGTTTVVYTATDIHTNVTTASFTITVEDNEAPVITLLGDATVEICEGETYTDAGATALDNCDGNITAWIVTGNPVNTAIPGTYTITYDVEDLSGNDAIQVARSVIVHALPVVTAATMQFNTQPANWMPLAGDLSNGFELCIDPMEQYYYLDINTLTVTQPLATTTFTQNAFYLDVTSVPANYYSYWAAKGVVNGATGWQGVMWNIINGTAPMFYINYTGLDYQLIDGLQYLAGAGQNPLRVNGEYPQGSYIFTGTVEDVNGCTSLPFDVMIDFNTIPYMVPVSDQVFCSGETVPATILAGTVPGTTFAWTNSNTSIGLAASGTGDIPSFTANNNGTTNGVAVITVTPTASGCIGAPVALYTITVNELPAAPVSGGDLTICEEAYLQTLTATATAPAGAHIVWYNAATGGNVVQSQTLSVVGTVTYWAESVNHVTYCVSAVRTPVTLTINPAPAAPVSGGNQIVCEITPVQTLTATATAPQGVSIVWYDAPVAGNIVQNPTLNSIGSVTYFAEAIHNMTNCNSLTRTPVLLQIDQAPAATIQYPGTPFCSNELVGTVVRMGTPNGTYFAFQPGIVIDPLTGDINIQASVPGQYTIGYVMPGNGACPPTVTTTSVYIEQIPQATISYSGTPFCYNGGSVLPTIVGTQGGLFSYYQWPKLDLNTITGQITLNGASDPGTYTVFYSFAATPACPQVNTSASVQVLPQITINGVAKDVSCIGAADGEIDLTINGASAPLNYVWSGPTVIGNVQDPIGLLAGSYAVTITDANNCAVTYSITVGTVPDITPPVIICPADITQDADAGLCSAVVSILNATATDNCLVSSVAGLRSDAMLLADPYPVGVTTIIWTAIDNSGNSAVCLQTVTINDEEEPVLACPADIYQTAGAGMCSALITVGASASDNCGIPTVVGVRSDQLPLSAAYPVGTTYIAWTATDGANNTDVCIQMIVVTDDENPVITCPADINVSADEQMCTAEISIIPATATDNCSAVGAASNLSITGVRSDALALTAPYPVGATTITWTAVDLALNSAVCVQTIVVTDDEDPMISCPNDIYQNADAGLCNAVVIISNATATDNCLVASVTGIRSDALALSAAYPVGTTTITWTALDVAGNSDVCTQLVVITDDEDPVITCPANIAQSADAGLCSAVITIVPATATDNCNIASVTGFRSDQMALTAAYPVGTTTIHWVAIDGAGNSAVCTQMILVSDDEDPAITCPADINAVADLGGCSVSFVNPTNNMLTFFATATDNCNVASVNGVRSDMLALTAPYPVGTTTITWTAIDDAGNSDVCVQTIIVTDNQNPDITCPVDITVNNAAGLCESLVTITPAVATDNCAIGSVIGVRSDAMALNAAYPVGITTILWTATDIHSNMSTCVQTITVLDVELPVIMCEPDIVVTFDYDACEATVTVTPPAASDNCGVVSLTGYRNDQLAVNDPYPVGLTTITWVATDVNGNFQTCMQTVKVNPYQVIVNYTFNNAALYPIMPDEVAFGLSSYATSFEPYLLSNGTVTGPQAFISDNTLIGNNALSMAQSNGNNIRYFEFQVTGDSLYRYRDFQLYLQGRRQANAATKITAFYSLDGLNFLKADSLLLTAADSWFEGKLDISDLDTIDYAKLLYFRFYVSGTNVISGNTRLDIDNLQLVATYGPLARPDFVTVPMNGSITIPVLNNDYYGCAGPDAIFPIIGVDVANNGTSTHNPNGTITYVPDPNYVGPDFFTYRITDANGRSDTAIVKVMVIPTSFVLNAKVFLQGPFDPATGLMWDSLRAKGYIPTTEPYSAHPAFTHAGGGGGETVASTAVFSVTGPNAIVDWVFVEFRDKNNPAVTIQSRAALLQRDGDIVDVDGVSPLLVNGILDPQVYVSVRHRNHLGVMTAAPVTLSNIITPLDFTNGSVAEFNYGNQGGFNYTTLAQKDLTINKRGLHAGNPTQDGKVKYQGANSDRNGILSELLNYPGNILYEYNFGFAYGYLNGDIDLSGQMKYQGAGSDRNVLLNVILNYVPGATESFDFMIEQLP